MSKVYNLDQHWFAVNSNFKISYMYRSSLEPHIISYVTGFHEVLRDIHFVNSLNMDEMFRIFIDNKASSHSLMYLDDYGNILTFIKIELDKTE